MTRGLDGARGECGAIPANIDRLIVVLAALLPDSHLEPILTIGRGQPFDAFCNVKIADDGSVTGSVGLDSHEGFGWAERPFIWRSGRFTWLLTDGARGSALGLSRGRIFGYLSRGATWWVVEWKRSPKGDWDVKPKRLYEGAFQSVVLGRSGALWVSSGKGFIRLDGRRVRCIQSEVLWLAAADASDRLFGNEVGGWSPLANAAMVVPGRPLGRLERRGRGAVVNDVDSAGRAVGHFRYNRATADGGLDQPPLPVEWRNGRLRPLLALGPSGDALAAGDGGDAVGWYGAGGVRRACLWRGHWCVSLPVPVGVGLDSMAVAVDRHGTAAVIAEDEEGRKLYLVSRP